MKKTAIILGLTFFSFLSLFAQDFTGSITFNYSYDGRELEATEKAQMPTSQTMTFGLGKVKTEIISPMGNIITIYDVMTKETTMLLDIMGQKLAIIQKQEDTKKKMEEQTKGVKIDYPDESKQIAGYNCKKAVITKGDTTITLFFTSDLKFSGANEMQIYKDIDGIVLESTMPTQDEELTMKIKATEIEKRKVKKNEFNIPGNYKIVTPEELKSMFGGQ